MEESTLLLAGTAVTIGFVHTLVGPDHYLPFIVMGEARRWSIRQTMLITFLCGLGHVLSSIVVGFIGIAAGISLSKPEFLEGFRGNNSNHDGGSTGLQAWTQPYQSQAP